MSNRSESWEQVTNEFFESLKRDRGISYSEDELAGFHKLVEQYSRLEGVPLAILAASPVDRRLALDEFVQLALGSPGDSWQIPNNLIRLLIRSAKHLHLCAPLYWLVITITT